MWCLEVIKHMNKPKPREEESQPEPREDQTSSS